MDTAIRKFEAELRWRRNYLWGEKIFTAKMNLELKKIVIKCLVCCMQQRRGRWLRQTEDLVWRRTEKVSWLDKVTNKEVLRKVNEDRHCVSGLSLQLPMSQQHMLCLFVSIM